jgi:adenosylhomocysteine nucleosidase|tara:strand:+ start:5048 stop:5770 length:723 start_codon:yes stop_codon:yes gene_type:complete
MLSKEFLTQRGYCCGFGCLMCPYEPKHTKGNTNLMSETYGTASELNKKTLIVCALEVETQGQLDDYDVLYTGVGKVNATFALTQKFGKFGSHIPYDNIINYGTAGSRKIKKKTLVDCTKFIQRDMDVTGLGFMRGETPFEQDPPFIIQQQNVEFNPIGRNATCGTGDNFAEDKSQYYGEVVDMEAYALAKVCYLYGVPFISFKYITDGADEQAHEDWEKNLADGIEVFKEKVLSKLDESS